MTDTKVSGYTPLPMPNVVPTKRLVTVAATQMYCTADAARNEATAEALVREAHSKGANIILIQELFQALYFCQEQRADLFSLAAPATLEENPLLKRFAALSAELNVVLPISFFERANKAHYNSIVIIDAGKIVGLYRKAHIPDGPGYTEKFYFNPGDTGFKVFRTQFGIIGVAICWDQWFPEAARAMSLMGAELLFYPTAIGTEPQDATIDSRFHWQRVMQGHAGANLVPVIASNRIGKEKDIRFYGKSFIAGPLGQLVQDADDSKQTVLTHTFDLNEIHVQRTAWGVFRDRRPELYTPLLSYDGGAPVAALAHRGFHHHRPAHAHAHGGHGPHHHGDKKHHDGHHKSCTSSASVGFSQLQAESGAVTTPLRDGYRFPAEWESHAGTWMLWPTRVGTWRHKGTFGQAAFAEVAKAISEFEPVTVCVPSAAYVSARRQLPRRIKVVEMAQDDAWMRDIGPTWIVNDTDRSVRAVDWEFNAWGGEAEGCYSDWSQDTLVKEKIATLTSHQTYKCPFVVEGGAIHTDGEGTLLTTDECMLNPNRLLPSDIAAGVKTRTREAMTEAFRTYLGVSKVIWLPKGVFGDKDTNGHIDNLACWTSVGHVALTWTDDTKDPQYAISNESLRILESSTDARGRKLTVHKVHQPVPQLMTQEDIDGLDQAAIGLAASDAKTSLIGGGTDMGRRVGDRMAASYINFYIANGGVIVPAFGDRVHDALAVQTLAPLFPGRRVVQVYSREILLGGGNIHCITQQEPATPAIAVSPVAAK